MQAWLLYVPLLHRCTTQLIWPSTSAPAGLSQIVNPEEGAEILLQPTALFESWFVKSHDHLAGIEVFSCESDGVTVSKAATYTQYFYNNFTLDLNVS